MPKTRLVALAALVAAGATAAGVAAASHHAQTTQKAEATFAAASVSNNHSSSCTASDGTYQDTTATYSGTATSSDGRLSGPLEIRAHSVVNTTTGLGWLQATFRVHSSGADTHGALQAAISGGNAVGTLVGEGGSPEGKLVASFMSAFTQNGGFASGSLGSGSTTGAGVFYTRGECAKPSPKPKPKPSTVATRLKFTSNGVVNGSGEGSFTLDVTRDSAGTITNANAVFYVNYRFPSAVTINDLALHQGAKGTTGPSVLDANTGTIVDTDGNGNITKTVSGIPVSLAQAILSNPRGYYVELDSSDATLRAQLGEMNHR